jgi:pfkB family carbohydrate kinase
MRLGVIGSFVWDVIFGRGDREGPVEEWGGITYALGALDAALPNEWRVVPLVKIGSDVLPRARDFLASLKHLAPDAAPIEVPTPNNRVELRYEGEELRSELLRGGVPPWTWLGLKPLLHNLDALYINLISGFELDLETVQLIRQTFHGPIYCDLHSLLLAVQPSGLRTPRPLPNAAAWFECFDLVQVNEQEMSMMAPDPMALAATAMNAGVRCLTVTMGRRGAVYVAAPGFDTLAGLSVPSRRARTGAVTTGAVRTELIPAAPLHASASPRDPTGCGDVFGATYFSRLLAGDKLSDALRAAIVAAGRNVEHRGATGLASFLRGELLPT